VPGKRRDSPCPAPNPDQKAPPEAAPTALRRPLSGHRPESATKGDPLGEPHPIHNPTGLILGDARRREIARLADEFPLYVIEDNTLGDLAFDSHPNHLLGAYAKQDRVLTVGSLSKSAWGGLRVGWLRAERGLIARMGRAKAAKDLSTSALSQLVAEKVLADYDRVLDFRRRQLRRRATLLANQLESLLPEWRLSPLEGGLSLWASLPYGSADEFSQVAVRKGVAVIPGSAHCLDGAGAAQLRLAFTQPDDVLRAGAGRLHLAWSEYASRIGAARDSSSRADVVPIRTQHGTRTR
jgi:DNA-binding transcriptional MocR family regulator